MKCNYKNRNSEGDKGFQALESYTKSLCTNECREWRSMPMRY